VLCFPTAKINTIIILPMFFLLLLLIFCAKYELFFSQMSLDGGFVTFL